MILYHLVCMEVGIVTEEMYKQEVGHSADLSIMLLLHCSSFTKISISSFRWCILEQSKISYQGLSLSCMHRHPPTTRTQRHTPGDHVILVAGCDSRLLSCSVRLQIEKDSVQSLRGTDEMLHCYIADMLHGSLRGK